MKYIGVTNACQDYRDTTRRNKSISTRRTAWRTLILVSTQQEPTTPPDLEKAIGQRVRALREERGLSQAHLGRLTADYGMPMNQPTLYKLENGMRPLRVNEVQVLALVLDVPIDDLLHAPVAGELGKMAGRYNEKRTEVLQMQVELNRAREALAETQAMAAVAAVREHEAGAIAADLFARYNAMKEELIEDYAALKSRSLEQEVK